MDLLAAGLRISPTYWVEPRKPAMLAHIKSA